MNIELNFPPKLRGARSRLYRLRILHVNTRWNSYLFEKKIEKRDMGRDVGKLSPRSTRCTPLHRFGIESQKPGKPWGEKNLVQPREKWPGEAPLHRFGIEFQKPGKPWREKNLVQPREKLPGEAHKQPQPATQYYLRALSEECLRIRNKTLT